MLCRSLPVLALLAAFARTARAEESPQGTSAEAASEKAWESAKATRRGGFTAGLYGGLSFGTVSGYPNDLSKLDNDLYRSATSGVGSAGMLYLGGALTDWFTFGFGLAQSSFGSSKIETQSGAFLFHIETFPLFANGGTFRDIGVFADFGTGTAKILRRTDKAEFSESGSLSIVGLGAFWEPWRFWGHMAAGPFVAWQYQVSDAMSRNFGEVGFRTSFYGGP